MLYIIIESPQEAEPFIRRLRLKKDLSVKPLDYFYNDHTALCVSGAGAANAANAVGYMAGYNRLAREDGAWLLHTGLCMTSSADCSKNGTLIYPHTLRETETSRSFYPDMLYRHPFREGVMVSACNKRNAAAEDMEACCVEPDMQMLIAQDVTAASVFQAAMKYMPPHRIIVAKAAMQPETCGSECVEMMNTAAERILSWLHELIRSCDATANRNKTFETAFTAIEQHLLDETADRLHLTFAMRTTFAREAAMFKSGGGDLITVLTTHVPFECRTKEEGKRAFGILRTIFGYHTP